MNNNTLPPPPLWLLQRRRQMMAKREVNLLQPFNFTPTTKAILYQIPLIEGHDLKAGEMVRFRCKIPQNEGRTMLIFSNSSTSAYAYLMRTSIEGVDFVDITFPWNLYATNSNLRITATPYNNTTIELSDAILTRL